MNARDARRRAAKLAADLIGDEASYDCFVFDDDGKPLPPADLRRMEVAVASLVARLRRVAR